MPNDRNKEPLAIGDTVYIECVITSLGEGDEGNNCSLRTAHQGWPGSGISVINCNSMHCEKIPTVLTDARENERAALDRVSALERDLAARQAPPPSLPASHTVPPTPPAQQGAQTKPGAVKGPQPGHTTDKGADNRGEGK